MMFLKVTCVFWSVAAIIFEFVDIGSDFKKWYEYKLGHLEPTVNSDTERAFLAFAIIGTVVSLAKVVSSAGDICLGNFGCGDDEDADDNDGWDSYGLCVTYLLFVEAIPQSILGWLTVVSCPTRKHGARWVDQFFADTCLLQYFPMVVSYAFYACKCSINLCCHAIFWVFLIVGVAFASLQIDKIDCHYY